MPWHLFVESFSETITNILGWFDSHNGLVQALATIILVFITFRSIKEAQDTRKDTRLPIIKLRIQGPINYKMERQYITFYASNIGYGLALDVKLNFIFSNIKEVDFGNIETGDENIVNLQISPEELEQIKKATKLSDVIVLSYKDIFDRTLTTFASIIDEHADDREHDWPVIEVSKWRVNLPE